jgi:hypothetical protein
LAWDALDDPQKLACKQLEINRLATTKCTVYELVKLRNRVVGGSLGAIAMEDVVRSVDPAFCAGKSSRYFSYFRAKAFSDRLAELTRNKRKSDADLLGNSSPSLTHKRPLGKKKGAQGQEDQQNQPAGEGHWLATALTVQAALQEYTSQETKAMEHANQAASGFSSGCAADQ